MNPNSMDILDFLGMTKTEIDSGDASMRTVPDQEAIRDRMDNFADVASQMRPQFYNGPTLLQSGQAPTQPMGFPNPYTSGNYGTMQPQMTGGIGSVPTIDQILAALQARQ